ncbi:helix-turn-helix protein [Algoriphagus boseongensis]|uniref:Helix-turn-helix protein n=1 Tax=Algoriphagus boseongensis TaxID=1442587 RepID=A0A4R6T1X8_9BACT|nr:helix-turn-helix domain-containing protein [Algoriphagus boseongensis]TDQ15210.1 helix-turn-helix protein [Algoriphagus boseongensis]
MNHFILTESKRIEEIQTKLVQIESILLQTKTGLPNLLRTSEIKKILKIKDSTLATLRSNGTLPFVKIAGTIYYREEDIQNLIEKNYSGNDN